LSKQELGKVTFKSLLIKGRLWKLVDRGSSKETQRHMTGDVAIGGNMDMCEGLRCQRMQIGII